MKQRNTRSWLEMGIACASTDCRAWLPADHVERFGGYCRSCLAKRHPPRRRKKPPADESVQYRLFDLGDDE